ncbi:MAG: hypothetical protein GY896_12580, partial [Gammaproteobacteria bacterium]|nr:hypothetical protein [Gammaproteobacteria bacterium]
GDFGFYDETSIENLTEREVRLHIVHSHLSDADKTEVLEKSATEQKVFIKKERNYSAK